MAKTALDVFQDILTKDHLERGDLELLIDRIYIFEDHIDVKLKSDIDALLKTGTLEDTANFKFGTGHIATTLTQSARQHADKVFRVHVISDGDPLEIYTERDGEVIFKKYSPMGDLSQQAAQICDAVFKNTGRTAVVSDRDCVIAVAGIAGGICWTSTTPRSCCS